MSMNTNSLNVRFHRQYSGLLSSLQRESRRDKSLIEKVYSSGLNDEYSKRKPFQHDSSLPRPFTGEVVRQKSKVVQKIRRAIQQKKTKQKQKDRDKDREKRENQKQKQKDSSIQQIHLLQKFIFTCKNFMNNCSRLIKTYSEVINDQDPLVKTVLSNRLQLSRIVNDIQKHNIFRMEQENQELKKMIDRLKKMMSLSKYKQTQIHVSDHTLHKQSYELIKRILKERFQLKDYLEFERVIETSEREMKIRNILTEKNLCSKSEKKFVEMLENVEREKTKVVNSLMKSKSGHEENNNNNGNSNQILREGYEMERSLNKKLKQLLQELNVQNNTTNSLSMFQLLQIKIISMRAELIPNLMQSNYHFTLQISKLNSQLQNRTNQLQKSRQELNNKTILLQKRSNELNVKSSYVLNIEKQNRRLLEELKDVQSVESLPSSLTKFKQPEFREFSSNGSGNKSSHSGSQKKIEELQQSNRIVEKKLNKYYNELKNLCDNHQIIVDNQENGKYEGLLEAIDLCILSERTKMMEIEKQNAYSRRKIEDLEEQFENVIRDKLRFEQNIEELRNRNKQHQVVCKQRLDLQKKKSSSQKERQRQKMQKAMRELRQEYLMNLADYQGEIMRLRERVRKDEQDICDLEGKVKIRDEINQQMMQEKIVIEGELECRVELTGSLEMSSMKLKKEKEEVQQNIKMLEKQNMRLKEQRQQLNMKTQLLQSTKTQLQKNLVAQQQKLNLQKTKYKEYQNKLVNILQLLRRQKQFQILLKSDIQNRQIGFEQNIILITNAINQFVSEIQQSNCKSIISQIIVIFSKMIVQKQSHILRKIESESSRINLIDVSAFHNIIKKKTNMTHTFQTQTQIPELFREIGCGTQIIQNFTSQAQTDIVEIISVEINTQEQFISKQSIIQKRQDIDLKLKQLKQDYNQLTDKIQSELKDYKSSNEEIVKSIEVSLLKEPQSKENLFNLLESKFKLQEKPYSLQSCIALISKLELKQAASHTFNLSSSPSYYQTLEKMIQQFLYNKVNLNLQQQIKALPPQQKEKMNTHKKKIGQLQTQLTSKDHLNEKITDLNKLIQTLKNQHKNLQKKLQYYQQDNNQKQSLIQQLKSNNKQMLNCIQIPNDTLSLIGQQDGSGEAQDNFNQIILCDLLDQSGICNDQLQFTKTELTKVLKQLNNVRGKLRALDKNSRQIINYLKLSIISMIESIENSKDDGETLKHLLSQLRGCKGNIK